jgi:hypothetical protein
MRAVRGLVTAARYLTIVPVPGRRDESPDSLGRAAPWFPAVGAAIGLGLVVVDHGVSAAFPPVLASLLTVTAWKLVTGGLHLDGLADSLDGFMGHDRARDTERDHRGGERQHDGEQSGRPSHALDERRALPAGSGGRKQRRQQGRGRPPDDRRDEQRPRPEPRRNLGE